MRRLLLDTHVWIWHLAGSGELPSGLRDAIEASAGLIWLSPISVWEVGVLVRQEKIRLPVPLADWLREATSKLVVREAPTTVAVAERVEQVELPHPDPADRFLAATALVYDLTLVTVDRHLVEAEWLPTLTA